MVPACVMGDGLPGGRCPRPAYRFESHVISSEKMRIFLTAFPGGFAAVLGGVVRPKGV